MSKDKLLPYVFNASLTTFLRQTSIHMPMNCVSCYKTIKYLGFDIYNNFSYAYTNTLKAIAD